ncbi:MAG: hypothetical protein ACLFPN_01270 [Methanomassiliicoccales archaeon]
MRIDKRELTFVLLTVAVTALGWGYTFLRGELGLFRQILVPFSFVTLGMLVKYGDQAFDTGSFDRRAATLLAVPGGLWMGSLIVLDMDSATIFTGLLLALLVAAKYDNFAFRLSFAIAGTMALASFLVHPVAPEWLAALPVFGAALVDEKVNDLEWVEEPRGWRERVLAQRPFLKVAVLCLCLVGALSSLLYFFAFLGFDFAYSWVESVSHRRLGLG